ncbi:MAG TPA: hypothetical protein PLD82_06970, partial [Spirochaetota bacterium]|nr:hypothetical protein [Spirochaetota bacterium]
MDKSRIFDVVNQRIVIGTISAENLVGKYGSPLFVYLASSIRQRINILKDAIKYPRLQVSFALRANSSLAILRLLYKEGAVVTAASSGEVMTAFKAGFSPHHILAIADLLTDSEIEFCHDRNVRLSFGSVDAISRFGARHRGSEVSIRVSPGRVTGGARAWNDVFGFVPERMDAAAQVIDEFSLRVTGVHASDSVETISSSRIIERLDAVFGAAQRFPEVTYINVGGGLGLPVSTSEEELDIYHFGDVLTKRMQAAGNKIPLTLAVEPGRYLVSDAGYLLMRVIAIRMQDGIPVAVTDASTHLLPDIRLQGRPYLIANGSNPDGAEVPVQVAGCATDSGDFFSAEPVILGEVRVGDILVVSSAGAYAMALAGVFNMRPRPAEVLIEEGRDRLVRKRESIDDIL